MLRIIANAKVNLFLEITGRLPSGYHTVDTIMQSVSVSDLLEIELLPERDGISLHVEGADIPTDERNIAYVAAKRYLEACGAACGAELRLHKHIPSEAGMGGGSADAAAVLSGLNELCGGLLTDDLLWKLASTIGADVPFCLRGGTQRLGGIGTDALEVFASPELYLVVAKPHSGISTPKAYGCLDSLHGGFVGHEAVSSASLCAALREARCDKLPKALLFNRFEEAVRSLCPSSDELIRFMNERSSGALLSGSGAAVFAIAESERHAYELEREIRDSFDGYFVITAKTRAFGSELR